MAFVTFMNSTAGRGLRIVAGLALIIIGSAVVEGTGGLFLSLIGLAPLITGAAGVCLLSPLVGGHGHHREARS